MKIAICDDEVLDLKEMERLIHNTAPTASIWQYTSSAPLLRDAETELYDLVFMDIEMPSPNGFDAAIKLRQLSHKPLIVFVTHSSDYAIRGYGIAFRYLKKPVSSEEIASVLELVSEQLTPQKLVVQTKAETTLIPLTEIRYIEVRNHQILISAGEYSLRFRGTLGSLLPQLPTICFAQPHNSFVVNLGCISSVSTHQVVLTDNSTVPLSQRRKKAFEAALFQYIRR